MTQVKRGTVGRLKTLLSLSLFLLGSEEAQIFKICTFELFFVY